jgi:twitching motility protein PilT
VNGAVPFPVDDTLAEAVGLGASDIHFTVGLPPQIRVGGAWRALGKDRLRRQDCEQIAESFVRGETEWQTFRSEWEYDTSYSVAGVGRFRVNLFLQRGSPGIACRVLPFEIPHFEDLGLPEQVMERLCVLPSGLILVCGPTGSGKSTTLAAMIGHINRTRHAHIVTMEDPIEFLHQHQLSIVDQREVGLDTKSFLSAMRHVLRQSPDVVLVGEIRDQETVRTAIMLAETGHLVLSTIHAGEIVQGLSRITDMFPPEQQEEVKVSLASVLKAMLVQQLIPRQGHAGERVLAYEAMLINTAIQNLVRQGKYEMIYSQLQTRHEFGMKTMNDSLLELFQAGAIDADSAYTKSTRPNEIAKPLGI